MDDRSPKRFLVDRRALRNDLETEENDLFTECAKEPVEGAGNGLGDKSERTLHEVRQGVPGRAWKRIFRSASFPSTSMVSPLVERLLARRWCTPTAGGSTTLRIARLRTVGPTTTTRQQSSPHRHSSTRDHLHHGDGWVWSGTASEPSTCGRRAR